MTTMTQLTRMTGGHRRLILTVLASALLLALAIPIGLSVLGDRATSTAGYSGGSTGEAVQRNSTAGGAASSKAQAPDAGAAVGAPNAAPGPSADASAAPQAALPDAKIARSAWLGVEVKDLAASSAQARIIATTSGGQVTSENVVTSKDGEGQQYDSYGSDGASKSDIAPVRVNEARLSLSVPSDKLDPVLTDLSRLGTVAYRSSQSQDVTNSYVDTQARITTMQTGVDSIRALLAKATSLDQIISLERDLTNRQADLDSLRGRLASLDRRTTMSDVTVTLWTSGTAAPQSTSDNAFVANLKAAWDTFLTSVSVILTGLAALLPWLVIALLVALVLRRTLRGRFQSASTPGRAQATPATATGPTATTTASTTGPPPSSTD